MWKKKKKEKKESEKKGDPSIIPGETTQPLKDLKDGNINPDAKLPREESEIIYEKDATDTVEDVMAPQITDTSPNSNSPENRLKMDKEYQDFLESENEYVNLLKVAAKVGQCYIPSN